MSTSVPSSHDGHVRPAATTTAATTVRPSHAHQRLVPEAGAAVGPEEEPAPDATEPRDRRGSRGSEVRMGRSPVGGADRDDHLASARFSRMRAALPWRSRM